MIGRKLAAALLMTALASCQPVEHMREQRSLVMPAAPPAAADVRDVEWGRVEVAGAGAVLIAVARPKGRGPFPAVVVLHGTHGFAREYVRLARDLAKAGVIAVAACWFAPGAGAGMKFVTPLACPPDAPPITDSTSAQAQQRVAAIIAAVRTLPGVDPGRIALFGHSRGGGASWNYVLSGGDVQALVLNSAGYPPMLEERAAAFDVPVLILHGEADDPADGGSPMTKVARARAFEMALRRAGKSVTAIYYPDGRHNGLFADPREYRDKIARVGAFLRAASDRRPRVSP